MRKKNLLGTLMNRLNELQEFSRTYHRRIEPYRYPKGLFRAQDDPHHRYNIECYLDEINEKLLKLQQESSPLMKTLLAQKILQQITVLTVSLKSQTKSHPTQTTLEQLLERMHMNGDNAFHYLCEVEQRNHKDVISDNLKEKESRRQFLNKIVQKKNKLIEQDDKTKLISFLKEECQEITKQINQLEKEIEQEKAKLSSVEVSK